MLTKVHIVKAMAFSVVMYGCESWTIKKAEHQRIYAFELWCWRRLFRAPWTARISNQSILNEINLEYLLEGLRLKLKLQYFSLLMRRADSLEKTLMLGKIEGRRDDRGWDGWMASLTQWMWVWANSGRWWGTGKPGVLQWLSNWTTRGHVTNRSTIFSVLASRFQGKAVNPKFEFYSESDCSLEEGSRLYSGTGSQSHFYRAQGMFKETSQKRKKTGEAGWNVMPGNCLGKKQRNKGNLSKKVMQIVKYLFGTSEKHCSRCLAIWVVYGKITWRRAWQPSPVFLLGESPWTKESSIHGVADTAERLGTHTAKSD